MWSQYRIVRMFTVGTKGCMIGTVNTCFRCQGAETCYRRDSDLSPCACSTDMYFLDALFFFHFLTILNLIMLTAICRREQLII